MSQTMQPTRITRKSVILFDHILVHRLHPMCSSAIWMADLSDYFAFYTCWKLSDINRTKKTNIEYHGRKESNKVMFHTKMIKFLGIAC